MSDATKQAITSFQGGASNPAGSAGSNIATVTIGSSTYTGWTSISITRSVEACPNAFTFAGTELFPGTDAPIVQPGSPCTVKIGSDVVVTGYIDLYQIDVAPEQHGIVLQGRGLCEDLVDCSADIASPASGVLGGFINATSTLDLAQRLSKPFGVACRSAVSDLGPPLNGMQIALGETPYEVIERAARYCGYLVYEDENGALVLDRVGTAKMASGFTVGGDAANVESAVVDMSLQGRFSIYTVVWVHCCSARRPQPPRKPARAGRRHDDAALPAAHPHFGTGRSDRRIRRSAAPGGLGAGPPLWAVTGDPADLRFLAGLCRKALAAERARDNQRSRAEAGKSAVADWNSYIPPGCVGDAR